MTDLIIIGSGPGGYRAADYAARAGLTVTIVEEGHLGGTCLNCGCIPTKAFCHDAELASAGLPLDFAAVCAHKQEVVEQLRGGIEGLMSAPGITLLRGRACLDKEGDEVVVRVGDETLHARHIIIATGSRPKMPPIPGIYLPGVVTSTELLDTDHIPQRLVIVGAGVIGMEFAGVFSAMGSQVTMLEFMKECLPTLDEDIAKRLRKSMEKRGITFQLGAAVKEITVGGPSTDSQAENSLTVHYERKGKAETVEADTVLVATGRAANVEGLGLEALGIATDRRGIVVDAETLEVKEFILRRAQEPGSSGQRLFAIGDVNGRQMLAHAATFQGFRAVNTILGRQDGIRLDIMPAAVFTTPEAAGVGPTEEQLKAAGRAITVHRGHYKACGKALAIRQTEGVVKLITDAHTDAILACHILGAHASDMVQEVTALMNRDATLQQLRETIHIHPTLSEILQDLA